MTSRHTTRSHGGTVAAVHEVDVGAFLRRTSEQGLQMIGACAVCGAPLDGIKAGAYKRLGVSLEMCCDAPSCVASFVG